MLGIIRPPPYSPFLLPRAQSLALLHSTTKAMRRKKTFLSRISSSCIVSVSWMSSDVATKREEELEGIRISFADLSKHAHAECEGRAIVRCSRTEQKHQ